MKRFGSTEIEVSEHVSDANVKGKGKWPKKKGQGNGKDATKSSKIITCHYCGKEGHVKKYYKNRLREKKSNQGGPQPNAHVAENIEDVESPF